LDSGTDKTVPLADVAAIVCAARDTEFSASSLRRMAELNVVLLICNEKFEPCSITVPYYRPTNTELLRRQIEWTPEWKTLLWRQIITAKVRNQAANLAHLKRAHAVLDEIAKRCEKGGEVSAQKVSVATLTASKRAAFLSDSPDACESRAARHYWKHLLPRLIPRTDAAHADALDVIRYAANIVWPGCSYSLTSPLARRRNAATPQISARI
jgi:CRISPR/Cas system-associated endonuclease Cas1